MINRLYWKIRIFILNMLSGCDCERETVYLNPSDRLDAIKSLADMEKEHLDKIAKTFSVKK